MITNSLKLITIFMITVVALGSSGCGMFKSSLTVQSHTSPNIPFTSSAWGGSGSDQAVAVEIAPDGSIVLAGPTSSTTLPDGLTYQGGPEDFFLVKYSAYGIKLFSRDVGTSGDESFQNHGLGFDAQGNIYFGMETSGSFPGFANAGGWDVALGKMDPNGNQLWMKQYGLPGDDVFYSLVVDPATGVTTYLGWDGQTYPGSPVGYYGGYNDCYIAQVDTNGVLTGKALQIGTPSSEVCRGLARDSSGNFYVGGYTAGSLPGFTNPNVGVDYCAFFMKLDSNFNILWTNEMCSGNGNDGPTVVSLDSNNNLYFAGYDSGSLFSGNLGGNDIIVGKLNGSTGALIWGKQFGSPGNDTTSSIKTLPDNSIIIGANTDGAFTGYTNQGSTDAYLVRMDSNGNIIWEQQIASSGAENSDAVAVDLFGNVYAAINSATPSTLFGLMAPYPGSTDVFLFKYNSNGIRQ